MRKRDNIFNGVDWILIGFYLIFVVLGWLTVYAATFTEGQHFILNLNTSYGRQMVFIAMSILIILVVLSIDRSFYETYAGVFYLVSMLSLLGLFVFGKNINGATSWYGLGGFSLQPSEFAKFATSLALANFLSERGRDLKNVSEQLKAFALILFPAVLIVLQPDAGSALVYFALVFVLYLFGLPLFYMIIGFMAVILFLITLYFGFTVSLLISYSLISIFFIVLYYFNRLYIRHNWITIIAIYLFSGLFMFSVSHVYNKVFEQHHRDRFDILFGKISDSKGIGYNTDQSIITVATGGLKGKGYLQGDRTHGDFVPEQETDYIFSSFAEEWGFIGTSILVILFVLFLMRLIFIAERQRATFSKVYAYAVLLIFFFHFTINIGMVIGLLPTIGIPLPFFSYGGSSLWGFTVLLFILIRLDASRIYEW